MIGRKKNQFFKNIEGLRNNGISLEYSSEQFDELRKCRASPLYFVNNYVKIRSLDHEDSIPFTTFPYQDRILNTYHENQRSVVMMSRQQGKSVTTSAYILWSILFHAKYNVVILAYDLKSAVNVLNIIKGMYEELPYWMQQGIEKWSEKNIVLENGSTVLANATTKAGVRGKSCNLLYIDEFGIVDNKIAPVFLTASYPVIFSSKKAKIIVSSTPLGYNHFYDLWKDAESGKNGFVPVKVHYSEHPGRDEEWANEQLKLLKRRAFNQEVLCQFAGSANTLLDSTILERIHVQEPITEKDGLKIFEYPVPDRKYVMTVDTAEGIGQDRSTFVVMDITERPYRIVATYQSDSISYLFFPDKIKKVASDYNEAYVLVETNSVGNQVAVILHNDLEYENILRFISEQKKGQILSSDSRAKYGLVMSAKAKSIGCRALRTLMEEDLITVNDSEILHEFNNFVEKGNTFKADDGYHDDLVMTLVSFAYLTQDKTFQTYIDTSRSMEFGKQISRETGDIGTPSFFYFDDGSGTEVEDEEELIGF